MEQLSRQELLKGIQTHNPQVVRQIYQDYYPMIERLVIVNQGSEEEAKDVFQETLVAIYEQLKSDNLRFECSFKTYCYAIARNTWLMMLRQKKRVGLLKDTEVTENLESQLIDDMTYARRRLVFQKHMEQLGADCQQILKSFFQKKPLKEIAEAMSLSAGYVKKRKHICQQKLIKAIKEDTLFNELTEHKDL